MPNEMEIAPLRSLDDFLLGSARFQVPNVRDVDRWANRVLSNLLYYQTNYFILWILVFLLIGMLHPGQLLCGMIATGSAFALFIYVTRHKVLADRFKRKHPMLSVGLILAGGYLIVHFIGSVAVFWFGVLLPVALIFAHSSMRLRNIKNRIANKMETLGVKTTPMGAFLETLGQQQISMDN